MRTIATATLVVLGLSSTPAPAQILDLSTIKCKDFVASGKENVGIILAWLNAYYKDEDAPAILDFAQLAKEGEQLGARCGANPEMGLITAADALFDK